MDFAAASQTVDASVVLLFGEATEYAPLTGPPSQPRGVFMDPSEPAAAFVVSVEGNDPVVIYCKSDVPSPRRGDLVTVRETSYAVKSKTVDEGALVILALELRS